jgi:O-antigen/teichoic acid export membrane protein
MAALANTSLDRLLLGAWLPASQLGLYTVAVTLATLPTALVSGITQLALPESASRQGAVEPLIELSRLVFGTMLAISLLLIPVALFGVPMIYGAGFRGAVPSALVLLAGLPPYATLGMLRQTATGQDRPWAGTQSEGVAVICTVVGLVSLVPRLGILGAAITSTVTYYAVYLLLAWMVTRDTERSIGAAIRPRFPDGRLLSSLGRHAVDVLLRRRAAGVASA